MKFSWRQERDSFIKSWTPLINASKDVVPETEVTFEDLSSSIAEIISSNDLPEIISTNCQNNEVQEPVEEAD